jgi:hypothetical protein
MAPTPDERLRERELERRRDNEEKDLETESTHGERPLEGLSSAPTTWTGEQDDSQRAVHEDDERASQERSRRELDGVERQVHPERGRD